MADDRSAVLQPLPDSAARFTDSAIASATSSALGKRKRVAGLEESSAAAAAADDAVSFWPKIRCYGSGVTTLEHSSRGVRDLIRQFALEAMTPAAERRGARRVVGLDEPLLAPFRRETSGWQEEGGDSSSTGWLHHASAPPAVWLRCARRLNQELAREAHRTSDGRQWIIAPRDVLFAAYALTGQVALATLATVLHTTARRQDGKLPPLLRALTQHEMVEVKKCESRLHALSRGGAAESGEVLCGLILVALKIVSKHSTVLRWNMTELCAAARCPYHNEAARRSPLTVCGVPVNSVVTLLPNLEDAFTIAQLWGRVASSAAQRPRGGFGSIASASASATPGGWFVALMERDPELIALRALASAAVARSAPASSSPSSSPRAIEEWSVRHDCAFIRSMVRASRDSDGGGAAWGAQRVHERIGPFLAARLRQGLLDWFRALQRDESAGVSIAVAKLVTWTVTHPDAGEEVPLPAGKRERESESDYDRVERNRRRHRSMLLHVVVANARCGHTNADSAAQVRAHVFEAFMRMKKAAAAGMDDGAIVAAGAELLAPWSEQLKRGGVDVASVLSSAARDWASEADGIAARKARAWWSKAAACASTPIGGASPLSPTQFGTRGGIPKLAGIVRKANVRNKQWHVAGKVAQL